MTQTRTIDDVWHHLKSAGGSVLHTRVDENHPLELYAEFEPPDRPGLVLFCTARPPAAESLRSVRVEQGMRQDGKWWLRLSLLAPELQPVFSALCRDIVASTKFGVEEASAAATILRRLARWRALLEQEQSGMQPSVIRGLIGELLVLEADVLSKFPELDAIVAWSGPLGTAQDFLLPIGNRIEVKAAPPGTSTVTINGLDQLDSAGDPLTLTVVRLLAVGADAQDAQTASGIISRLESRLANHPSALVEFRGRLAMAGWHEHPSHQQVVVRLMNIERYKVSGSFPRLTRSNVPVGVEDASYDIRLPDSRAVSEVR